MRSPSKLFVALGGLLLSVRPAFPAEPAKPQGNLPACYVQLGIFADSNGPSAPAVPEGLGVNIHFTDARPGEMKLLAASGLRWVRMDFTWSRIEKAKGQYDFTAYDRLISTLEASHICPLFILDYGNPLYDGGLSPYTEEGREAFARWAATSAQRFKDRGVLWEIWNEPNGSFWRPKAKVEDYVKLALAVGRAIRDAVPQEIYVGPATSGIKFDFLEACFQAGLLDYWRAVSVHPYRQSDPETAQAEYKRLQDLIAKYAPGKAIPLLALFAGAWLLLGGLDRAGNKATETDDELYRPQFHFTPTKNWMNDPNGPIHYESEYHLFYQHNPFANDWGHMSWGHAVSPDLVHWQHLPVALPEENGIMIFSGSTVVDWHNTSGFCNGSHKKEPSCLVAIYTGHTGTLQTQNLAYSNDHGRTWTKYSGNPVIDLHLRDFRDPKVFWHEGSHKWVMVAALPRQHKVRFFASSDLKHWTALGDFGPAGATGGIWECPDLFQLPVEGEPGQTRWVLSVNLNPGGVAGGSGDQYFVGQFDGSTFTSENSMDQVLWADYGKDFYASTSFSDIPRTDGRRIWLGWLVNWEYAAKIPTHPWRGSLSIPRVLKLKRYADSIRLLQQPVEELRTLRNEHAGLKSQNIVATNRLLRSNRVGGEILEIIAEIDPGSAVEVGLKVRKGPNEETVIGVDTIQTQLFVDRTRSGNGAFDQKFPGRHVAPTHLGQGKSVRLRLFVDQSSVEVFGNDGETVISDCIFPARSSQAIEVYSSGGEARILKLDVWKLRSAWQ